MEEFYSVYTFLDYSMSQTKFKICLLFQGAGLNGFKFQKDNILLNIKSFLTTRTQQDQLRRLIQMMVSHL